jgi:hypothetical protein
VVKGTPWPPYPRESIINDRCSVITGVTGIGFIVVPFIPEELDVGYYGHLNSPSITAGSEL